MTHKRHTIANLVTQLSRKLPPTEATNMRNAIAAGMIFAALAVGGAVAQQNQAEVDLQSAMRSENVDGDLKAAIQMYESVISKYKHDRPVAAMALVHMADCYQKLGDTQSRKLYDRVLHEYPDQKEAVVLARAQIGGRSTAPRATGDRPVWTGSFVDGFGSVSQDGRFLTYTDWPTNGGLVLRNLATGTDRRLTSGTYADGQTLYSAISRDGKQVVFDWYRNDKKRYEVRVASLDGSEIPQSKRLFYSDEVQSLGPFDWSPDGKTIAVGGRRSDLTGIVGLLDVASGELRVLKTVDWQSPKRVFFSPDGHYVAYDAHSIDNSAEQDTFVVAVDGSGQTISVKHPSHNIPMGWAPDGTHLLFSSDRSGTIDLWALPLHEGKPQGSPTLVKSGIGAMWSLGTTAAGSMYIWKANPEYVGVSPIDLKAGKLLPNADGYAQYFIQSRGRPDWSADGKYLAYSSCGPIGGGPCTLYIRSVENGQVRELQPQLASFFWPRWSPDAQSIVAAGTDLKGQRGIYRIDPQTGAISLFSKEFTQPQWTGDGTGMYYARVDDNGHLDGNFALIRRDTASGEEHEVLHAAIEGIGKGNTWSLSPDGRFVAAIAQKKLQRPAAVQNGSEWTLFLIPVDGSQPRTLLSVSSPDRLWGAQAMAPAWTPDSHGLLVIRLEEPANQKELWFVPIANEKPRKLDVDISHWTGDGFRLSPDGRRVAFVSSAGQQEEIWAIENFLPKLSAKQ
jgi:Tol biopolymer transport system component